MTTITTTITPTPPLDAPFRIPLPESVRITQHNPFRAAVHDALDAGHRRLELDCAACGYLDAASLGQLVHCAQAARRVGATLTLTHVHADLRTLLALTKLDTVLTIAPDPDGAPC